MMPSPARSEALRNRANHAYTIVVDEERFAQAGFA
jgi:hypothetical protein